MQTRLKFFGIICLATTLSACSYFEKIISPTPYSRQQVCSRLKHDLIFEANPVSPNASTYTPIQKAQMANRYESYHCTDFEPPPASPPEELNY
ncbi:MAG: hypothetical protein WBE18_04040 [Gammaproteobacteria bacterium]